MIVANLKNLLSFVGILKEKINKSINTNQEFTKVRKVNEEYQTQFVKT